MPVRAFDHYNLRAPRALLDELCAFYRDVVGLTLGERPPFRRFGYWLYAGERPVLHLGEADAGEACNAPVSGTFNHASFDCTDKREFERRLAARGIPYRTARVPLTGQVQLFFEDPAGNGVELAFASDEDDAGLRAGPERGA
jgi:catechol 2,3-dioxygenase-like lactoylglutathione lyase family enzyme